MPQTQRTPALTARPSAVPMWRIGDGAPPAGAFMALAPGADAPLIALGLPAALKGIAREDVARRQALDRLGGSAATLDIRPARMGSAEGWTRVAVANRQDVLRWRAALGSHAARCRGILPDYAALPTAPGLWTFAHENGVVRVRLGPGDGFTVEPELAEPMLALALQQAGAAATLPRAVLWQGPRIAGLEALLGDLPIVSTEGELPQTLHPQTLGHDEAVLDFARDPRADAAALEGRLRRMLWPVALLVLGALGWAGATAVSVRNDVARADAVAAQTLSAARRDLLGSAPILDLRVQVSREISARQGARVGVETPTTALDLLRIAAPVLAGAQVQAVALGGGVDGVALDLTVDDFRALDTVLTTLQGAGLRASVTRSAIAPEGGVEARITLIGGAP